MGWLTAMMWAQGCTAPTTPAEPAPQAPLPAPLVEPSDAPAPLPQPEPQNPPTLPRASDWSDHETMYAAFRLTPAVIGDGPMHGDATFLFGALRWDADAAVLHTERTRYRLDAGGLTESTPRSSGSAPASLHGMATDVLTEARAGFEHSAVSELSQQDLPKFGRRYKVDYFRVDLPFAWARSTVLVLGYRGNARGRGRLAEFAITAPTGQPLVWQGYRLHAELRDVAFGVPLGPDFGESGWTPFAKTPDALPWHKRLSHHPMAFDQTASQGFDPLNAPDAANSYHRGQCDAVGRQGLTTTLVWRVDPGHFTFPHLQNAVEQRTCTFKLGYRPRLSGWLAEPGATGTIGLEGVLETQGVVSHRWTHSWDVAAAGPAFRVRRGGGDLPMGTNPTDARLSLTATLSAECPTANGGTAELGLVVRDEGHADSPMVVSVAGSSGPRPADWGPLHPAMGSCDCNETLISTAPTALLHRHRREPILRCWPAGCIVRPGQRNPGEWARAARPREPSLKFKASTRSKRMR